MNKGDFGYFEFTTGDGNNSYGEQSSHKIKGYYIVAEVEQDKIYLREEDVVFPVMRSRITRFEKRDKPVLIK